MGEVWFFQEYCLSCWAGRFRDKHDLNELSYLFAYEVVAHCLFVQLLWDADWGHTPAGCQSWRLGGAWAWQSGYLAVQYGPGPYIWCTQWDLDPWAGRLSTIFGCRRIFLALSRRKCHVSHLQRGAPAFPVWLMIKGKQEKGTKEEGKQHLAFEECEWGLSERKGTDSTPGHIPSVTISVCFPSCSKSQLRTGLPACSEDIHANSGCEGDLKLLFFIPHRISGSKMYFQTI